MNHLYLGDNLAILQSIPTETVDLIYLDPPFFSNRNYEVIWGDAGEVRSFQDRWAGGVDHYIAWLKEQKPPNIGDFIFMLFPPAFQLWIEGTPSQVQLN